MTCKFSEDGVCTLWEDGMFEHISNSCDEEGNCLIEDDEYPEDSCEDYDEE